MNYALSFRKKRFTSISNSIHLIKAGNPTSFIRKFYNYVSPYKNKIINYDDEFFLQKDYTEYESETTLMESIKIRKIWKSGRLTDKSKKLFLIIFKCF